VNQIIATVVAGTVQLGVQAWMFTNIEYEPPVLKDIILIINYSHQRLLQP
jgi:hypothetical protein